ncbi:MAG: dienelactone hydrolase family protein, partial [Phycisphaerae bacterium]
PHGTKPVPDAEDHVTKAIGATISAYSVDEDRITLTGHSMGGEGSTRYAALHADRLAGVAPSAGSAVIVLEDAPALAKIGVWIFQGEHDRISTVALATRMVAAIRKAEGDVRYTEFKGVRHASAKPAYSDPKVIDWLLKQKRRTPSPKDKKPTRRLPDAEKAEKKAE